MYWQAWSQLAHDEAFWRNREEKGLLKAEYLRDYVLRLWFADDHDESIYELDFRPLIAEENPGEVFLPLRDPARFRLVVGDYALIWLDPQTRVYDENAIDLAPECVRFFCERYGKKIQATQSPAPILPARAVVARS